MNQISDIRKKVGREMSGYFKAHGYTQKDVAEMMNISTQTVANHAHGAPIGAKLRDAYYLVFGFDPEHLLTGKGDLVKKTSGYQKLKQENEMLRALVKSLRYTLRQYTKEKTDD